MAGLGECQQENCRGNLCVRGSVVSCEKCGTPQHDHPLSIEAAAAKASAPPPPAPVIPAHDYTASIPDRLRVLERQVVAQGLQIAGLQKLLTERERGGKRG